MTPASADVLGSGPVTAALQAPTAGRAPASLVALMRRLEEDGGWTEWGGASSRSPLPWSVRPGPATGYGARGWATPSTRC